MQAEEKKVTIVNAISREQWLAYEKYAEIELHLFNNLTDGDAIIKLATLEYNQISKLLYYVLFIGSDKGPSMHHAEGIFIFEEALNMNSWTIMTKEQAISYIIDHGTIELKYLDNGIKLSINFTIQ